jgi:glyceraldehyde 3-phosphate dehydrogenase
VKRIAINGFGRIGRTVLRLLLEPEPAQRATVVAINLGPSKAENLDILFAYDSIMGHFGGSVSYEQDVLIVNGKRIALLREKDPAKLPWKDLQIDVVVESSGAFTDGALAKAHCSAGAKKVIITAPAKNDDFTLIMGVNDTQYDKAKHHIISIGSCTTNCLAPIINVLATSGRCNIREGMMTTIHSYTNDQVLLDVEHKDPRRARAAGLNMIPTKTGAGDLMQRLFPSIDHISALAIRVPTSAVSLVCFSFTSDSCPSAQELNQLFKTASEGQLKGIMAYEEKPLVSSDFKGNSASCIIDSSLTKSNGLNLGTVYAWYDNEYGYSCRVRDFLLAA